MDVGVDAKVTFLRLVLGEQCEHVDISLQLKASYAATVTAKHIKYEMDVKDYKKLARTGSAPTVLVLYVMPRDTAQWLMSTGDQLSLRNCVYWLDMRAYPATTNRSKVIVNVPRDNVFDAKALMGQLRDIAEGWRA